jgi:cell division protein FtsX
MDSQGSAVTAVFATRTDLSLERDAQDRFLPWLVAFMVFLAVLAFALAATVHQVAGRWDKGARGTLTVQVPVSDTDDDAGLAAVLALLRATPGIASADPLADEQLAALIEPWIGRVAAGDIPIPRLVDVRTRPGARPDLESLRVRLAAAAPGTARAGRGSRRGRTWDSRRGGTGRCGRSTRRPPPAPGSPGRPGPPPPRAPDRPTRTPA